MTGIRVNFDLTFTNKAWVEAERYRFLEFVSSQSTMHRITKFDLREQYNEYVDPRIIDIMEEKVKKYNELANKIQRIEKLEEMPVSDFWLMDAKEELKLRYLEILYSNPAGF